MSTHFLYRMAPTAGQGGKEPKLHSCVLYLSPCFFGYQLYEVLLEHKIMKSFWLWHQGTTASSRSLYRGVSDTSPLWSLSPCSPPPPSAWHLLPAPFASGSEPHPVLNVRRTLVFPCIYQQMRQSWDFFLRRHFYCG